MRFRAAYNLYVAVSTQLARLYAADTRDSGWDYQRVVQEIERACVREAFKKDVEDLESLHDLMRHALAGIEIGFTKEKKHQHFAPIIKDVASSFRVIPPADCRISLDALNADAWTLFSEMIRGCGGRRSLERLNAMRGPSKLDLRLGIRNFTYCHYRPDEIRLELGTETDLSAFFDLPFYLLHEYVSHAFPAWDDHGFRLSEAYLLRAAFQYIQASWRATSPERAFFIGSNFDRLRQKADPLASSELGRAEDCFAQLHDEVGPGFVKFLLEWSTVPVSNDTDQPERHLALAYLHVLVRNATLRQQIFDTPANSSAAWDFQEVEDVLSRLYTAAIKSITT
jgi:hypothetical protein